MAPKKSRSSLSSASANPLGFSSTKRSVAHAGKSTKSQSQSDDVIILSPTSAVPSAPKPKRARGQYGALLRAYKEQMGRPMVQSESLGWTDEQLILHIFDNSDEYGPTACGTRLDRFKRARALGLNPPPEIEQILAEGGNEVQMPFTAPVDIKGKK